MGVRKNPRRFRKWIADDACCFQKVRFAGFWRNWFVLMSDAHVWWLNTFFQLRRANLVSEKTSALAFLLDNLLPLCQTAGDKDSHALVHTLVASLASCNHAPEAQNCPMAEVKVALSRAPTMPESNDKQQLQLIFNLNKL